MDRNYNANIYLQTNDLVDIENRIYDITNQIQEKIFNDEKSPLRNIEVGDNLNGRTLYISLPYDIYLEMDSGFTPFVTTDRNNALTFTSVVASGISSYAIGCYYNGDTYAFYLKYSYNKLGLDANVKRFKLPYDYGIVTSIDTNNEVYQYIKIYDDERIMPNYEKSTWNDNDFLSMQKIDNLENGIRNIGNYYHKPMGWVEPREWLKTSSTSKYDNNMNMQNISYKDLNRWVSDLNLIDFEDLDIITIWNSDVSEIDWNKRNETEWREL